MRGGGEGRNRPEISLKMPLVDCAVVHGSEAAALSAVSVHTVGDLLRRPPKRHEDRRRFDLIPAQESGAPLCLRVKVIDTQWKHMGPGRRYFEAIVEEKTQSLGARISCRWFHFPAISRMIVTGMELVLYGKARQYGKTLAMVHPEFEVVDVGAVGTSLHLERIVPVYGKTGGLNQRLYREVVWRVLSLWKDACSGTEDAEGNEAEGEYGLREAFGDLHFPDTHEAAVRARRHFSLEESFYLQLSVVWRRRRLEERKGLVTVGTSHLVRDLCGILPFELTESQKECVREIYRDMKRPVPMNRLVQGDVGSGKTLVSLCAMLMAVEAGYDVAMMAPTQILAEQHYKTCLKWLDTLGVKVELLTSSRGESSQGWGAADQPRIVVGTHALLYREDTFRRLGLVVIDEQHKFGVDQRERLISQGESPDVLVMTATPIPRTLTLTLYGDLDVSVIREKPGNRGRVVTALRTEKALTKVVKFVREQVDAGRQVYVVSPLVEESTGEKKRSGKSAVAEYELWKKKLPHVDIGLLHGRMGAEEKERVMQEFRQNRYSVLVATTVIEVGVDVPNATIMIINNADQFGLSQLHQLRGRVGRGGEKSYCILLSSSKMTEEGREKLELFEKISDGFELSEADFRMRGPGDMFGTAQSGLAEVQFPEWLYDTRLISEARRQAELVLDADPDLILPENQGLREKINTGEVINN